VVVVGVGVGGRWSPPQAPLPPPHLRQSAMYPILPVLPPWGAGAGVGPFFPVLPATSPFFPVLPPWGAGAGQAPSQGGLGFRI